ncbi:MOSC domain-containing protein [Streptomyces turgidiscabies]|uniref:MOSC domain protein n=1 Tax=Streptomyces turgidiscabies (strain Car8) TaxID=698760 RepID=L7EXX2_STRT8|nr:MULTISPECIES: MOSC N-terminal beta barrel domain-containing protein [Streptomyces]ELP63536.1 MOSC domain protein [Streptomyces turgidiscabies Car8]MDX3496217.1 MOSC domain-containing protein [Streptomyces turgidiscabies]GAQ75288.1 MOSC domain protein [Streptomyces turgidiscabies]
MGNAELHSIHIHPVKALRGQAPRQAVVEPWGLAGDRRWVLVDAEGKVVTQRQQPRLAQAAAELLPDGGIRLSAPGRTSLTVSVPEVTGTTTVDIFGTKVQAVLAADDAHAWCGGYLGEDVRLLHMDDPATRRAVDPEFALPGETVSFADGYPLLVTTLASLDALNSLIARGDRPQEGPLPMNRFRPNVVVSGTAAWAEDDWSRIAIGEVSFRVAKMCGRCVVTTTDQDTSERGREPLRALGRHRRFGNQLIFGQNLVPENPGTIRVGDPFTVVE